VAKEWGHAVLMVTHDPRMARFATRMIYILDGRLVSKEDYDQAIATQE
jgi:putative ABC transport system ATP-binding protein